MAASERWVTRREFADLRGVSLDTVKPDKKRWRSSATAEAVHTIGASDPPTM